MCTDALPVISAQSGRRVWGRSAVQHCASSVFWETPGQSCAHTRIECGNPLLCVLYVLYLTRQAAEHPLSPGSLLYVLYVLYLTRQARTSTLPGVPCYMCYMCYISQGKPLNIHSPRVPCYMCYMCYMALYSTYTTDFRAYRVYSTYSTYSKELGESGGSAAWRVRYSTYSTYSKDPGKSGGSAAWRVRYSTYSTYSKEPGESGGSAAWRVRYSTYSTYCKEPGKSVRYSTYSTYSKEVEVQRLGAAGWRARSAKNMFIRHVIRHVEIKRIARNPESGGSAAWRGRNVNTNGTNGTCVGTCVEAL